VKGVNPTGVFETWRIRIKAASKVAKAGSRISSQAKAASKTNSPVRAADSRAAADNAKAAVSSSRIPDRAASRVVRTRIVNLGYPDAGWLSSSALPRLRPGPFFNRPLTPEPAQLIRVVGGGRIHYWRCRGSRFQSAASKPGTNVWMRAMEARTIKPYEKALAELKLHIIRQRELAAALVRQGNREAARQARAKLLGMMFQLDRMQEQSVEIGRAA
jgi:hypothetical protein